jgi:Uma2 family endonuclease
VTDWVAKARRGVRALEKRTIARGRGRLESPMGVPATKQTVSDARRRYLDDPRRMEIHRGIVREVASPTRMHDRIIFELRTLLRPVTRRTNTDERWVIVSDVDIDFQLDPEEVRAPDLAGYRASRWRDEWDETVPLPQAPDWLCEVWSPGNTQQDREDLMSVYYDSSAVEYVWTIDRALPALKVFRRGPTTWRRELVIDQFDVVFEAEPFPGVELTLDALLE